MADKNLEMLHYIAQDIAPDNYIRNLFQKSILFTIITDIEIIDNKTI